MPFLWTEGRFIMSHLEIPTLREITAERRKKGQLCNILVTSQSKCNFVRESATELH